MSEDIRSISVRIEVDTNKQTYVMVADDFDGLDDIVGRVRDWLAGISDNTAAACHCGRPVTYGYDGDPTHHRGMCEDCDDVRCDAYPTDCPPWRRGRVRWI